VEYDDNPPASKGTVIRVSPSEGSKVDDGTIVTLTLATGNSVVPNVVGKSLKDAQKELEKAGLQVAPSSGDASEDAKVLSQTPSGGSDEIVDYGTVVTLTVATRQPDNHEQPSHPQGTATTQPTQTTEPAAPTQTDQPSEPTEPSEEGDPTER
ncbi:MAG: PASTA domain-containing protein, partial [Cutibacterium sp.]|nr:PASTA domain-containing protein [Cutibacterium sp.]